MARAAAARLGLPHVELDSLWWEPNWTEAGAEVLAERLEKVAANGEWIVDGNYFSVGSREVLWPRADTIASDQIQCTATQKCVAMHWISPRGVAGGALPAKADR